LKGLGAKAGRSGLEGPSVWVIGLFGQGALNIQYKKAYAGIGESYC